MKKLKFNSTLNHKQSDYKTREIIVEKVITLYGKSFSELKDHPLRDDPYIAENRDLMYIDNNDTAHCLLMVDYDSGDGILVESEGCGCPVDTSAKQKHRPRRQPRPSSYARKSQFIPNAEALIEISNLTLPERKLHRNLKKIVDHIAELAHCGEKSFVFEELLEKSDLDFKSLLRDSVTAMLKDREDVKPIQAEKQMVKALETMFEEDNSVHISTKAAASDTALNPQNTVSENSSPQTQLDDDDDWD